MLSNFVLRRFQKIYRYSRWMRVHFTRMGHLCLIVWMMAGVFGVDTRSSNTYQLFVFLSIIFCFALLASLFNRFSATVQRHLPRYATVDELLTYKVSVSNTSAKNYHHLVYSEQLNEIFPNYQELAEHYQRQHRPWYKRSISFRLWLRYLRFRNGAYLNEQDIAFLSTQYTEQITVSCMPIRRGKLVFTGAYIAKPDIFGLFKRFYFVENRQSCLILPKRYPIAPLHLSAQRNYQQGGVSLANSVGDSTEFMALRDYRHGDAINRIHWKSLARHNKLIVKEYQDEFFVRRALILDTELGMVSRDVFEAAVSVAASLAINKQPNDALLDLMFVGHQTYQFTTGRGVDHMPHLQEVLAAVQPSETGSFIRLQHAVNAHAAQCSSLFLVLLDWDAQRQELVKSILTQGIPLAVFLAHEGQLIKQDLENQPTHFYLINSLQIAADLAAI
ncbi:MAG: DUF58 domain-containing protein [Methyloprofundus sp.]|nr:DUF58 domain-containing protein [Methyloprofundus sp.]